MNKQTKKALIESIIAWEHKLEVVRKRDVLELYRLKFGPYNCPLCLQFFKDCCTDCPVSIRTEQRACVGSPYDEACDEIDILKKYLDDEKDCEGISAPFLAEQWEKTEIAVEREVRFLESLREQEIAGKTSTVIILDDTVE